jgi:hypothetical protein
LEIEDAVLDAKQPRGRFGRLCGLVAPFGPHRDGTPLATRASDSAATSVCRWSMSSASSRWTAFQADEDGEVKVVALAVSVHGRRSACRGIPTSRLANVLHAALDKSSRWPTLGAQGPHTTVAPRRGSPLGSTAFFPPPLGRAPSHQDGCRGMTETDL